ncbi:hypothetical protein S7711_02509 [Stachybotrys chartarum IBT 7711]|uniref:Regulator of chromosome condensation 1/beta-lactamase-inhibitor protein II n=1 Tax=Stachybotrys chartarum (strain CBS 109288 / IBT 7711) TaxID=1280523 RepID=A0A084B592_STACB|nr:hypothetical protein S7711_02509 [Stachybotrys chartarum IBT 7711]
MDLYAAGFNAWNQLDFSGSNTEEEPDDYSTFTKIIQGGHIEPPVARLSYTSAQIANGDIFTCTRPGTSAVPNEFAARTLWNISAILPEEAVEDPVSWTFESPVKQIAASDVGVVILHEDGSVSTMGDARFEDVLGREVNDDFISPASKPCKVLDLASLDEPIKMISAGGLTAAAITESGSLYVWGMASSGTHRRQQAFDSLNGTPNYIEVDDGKDVEAVAVGDSHAVLALGRDRGESVRTWTDVGFEAPDGQKVIGVAAGPRSSFILTALETSQ